MSKPNTTATPMLGTTTDPATLELSPLPCGACYRRLKDALQHPDRMFYLVLRLPGMVMTFCEHRHVHVCQLDGDLVLKPCRSLAEAQAINGAYNGSAAYVRGQVDEIARLAHARLKAQGGAAN